MKSFNDFSSAFNWVSSIVKKSNPIATEQIAKDVYKDSKEFTYLDIEDMYNSGAKSEFKKGYVLIKAPQVRKLYYIRCNPRGNKNARIMWFETTKSKNMNNYIKVISNTINKLKGG